MLNLLRQATLVPHFSAWKYFHDPYNYNVTPIKLLGCHVLIHTNPNNRKSWKFCSCKGLNVGPAFHHYRCYHIVYQETKATLYFDTVDFCHYYITQPTVTPEYCIVHAVNLLTCAIKYVPAPTLHSQIDALKYLQDLFS